MPLRNCPLPAELKLRENTVYRYILTKLEVKMAGYWLSSLFAFLWTENESIKDLLYSINSTEKNDLCTWLFSCLPVFVAKRILKTHQHF